VNDRFYAASRREPAYRTILAASSTGLNWLPGDTGDNPGKATDSLWAESLGLLARWLAEALQNKTGIIKQGESHVRELQGLLAEKDQAVAEGRLFAQKLEGEMEASRQSYEELEGGYDRLDRQVIDLLQHQEEIASYVRHVEAEFQKAAALYEQAAGEASSLALDLEREREIRSDLERQSAGMAARLAELERRYPERFRRFLQRRFGRG